MFCNDILSKISLFGNSAVSVPGQGAVIVGFAYTELKGNREKTFLIMEEGYVSASILQEKLGLEFSEAEHILKILEEQELVSHPDGRGFRSLLITQELWSFYRKTQS